MKVNSFNARPEEKYNKINKLLKEHFGVNLKSNPNPQKLVAMKKKLVEKNQVLRHEKQAHMKNKEFARNMLMLDAINNALLVARRQQMAKRALSEGTNVDRAEVIIAANSFLDDLQDSLEKVGRLQNETLGPIADRMRDYYGADVANSFYEKVNSEFDTVMDALRDAKKSIGSAITSVSKGKPVEDQPDIDSFDDEMDERERDAADEEDMGDDIPSDDASDLDIDLGDLEDDLEGAEEAGREKKVSESKSAHRTRKSRFRGDKVRKMSDKALARKKKKKGIA